MDIIEKYKLYQKGRYVKLSKSETKFFKLLDKIHDNNIRDEMLLLDAQIERENNILMVVGFLIYAFLGGVVGYVIGIQTNFLELLM